MYVIGATQVAVFRTRSGELFATQPRCPHKGGPLVDGTIGGSTVVCPLHAFKFNLATGAAVGNPCAEITTYPVKLGRTGAILLNLVAHMPTGAPGVPS